MLTATPHAAERDRAQLEAALRAALPDSAKRVSVRLLGYSNAFDQQDTSESDETVPISLTPVEVFVGPCTPGRRSPCAQCFALRWQKLRSAEFRTILDTGMQVRTAGPNPHLTPFLAETVAGLSEHLVTTQRQPPQGVAEVYGVATDTLFTRRYELLADPACSLCSPASPLQPAVIELRGRPKPVVHADRLAAAQDLLRHPDALVNPACGMLGKEVTPEYAHTTTVPATGNFQVRGPWGLFPVHWSGHADSESDSVAYALCEAIERYAGLACGKVPTAIYDCYANLTESAVDPGRCGLDTGYTQDGAHGPFVRYHRGLPIHWVWGHCLTSERPVLVPKQLAYYRADEHEEVFVKESSNGCASGSCVEEAILHGIFELVERDAFLLTWYGAAQLPEIDPDTCESASTRCLLERVRTLGYDVRAFDGRIDLDIPVVVVAARNRDPDRLGALTISAAAHLNPERALASALREVASCVAHLPERTKSNLDRVTAMVEDYSKVTELADHALLFGLPEMSHHADFLLTARQRRSMADVFAGWYSARPLNRDLTDDVRFCLDHLAGSGFDVIAVDQTTQEGRLLGIHTVCVIVPGMIPIDFGWAQQRVLSMPRMFEAFRNAGWRDTVLDPSELNRVPHPFM